MTLSTSTTLCSKTFFVTPLGVKRPDTSHCFAFVSKCQCFCFEQFIGCFNLFLFLFAVTLQFLLCCIVWEASGKYMLIMPLA